MVKTGTWKDIAELIGIAAIVVSLIAVVVELQQTQAAISASTYQARAFDGIAGARDQYNGDYAGFQNIETFSYGIRASYSHEAWRGRIRACAGVGGTLPPDKTAECDMEIKAMMEQRFPEDPLSIRHRIFAVIAKAP